MARPITWTKEKKQEAIDIILNEISENGKSVRSILDKADRNILPSNVTFCDWLSQDDKLVKQYARATEIRAEKIFDEILDIADESINDTYTDETGKEYTNHEVINRSRLRVDARKWVLSKMNPKKYGEKIDHTTNGESINIPKVPDIGSR
jgi:hypothetical protein